MNGDGTVNYLDNAIVATNYGATPTASLTAAQEWSLEALGNWKEFKEDDDSTLDWDVLDQDRDHNLVNEIGPISEGQGQSQWADPAYSARGNPFDSAVLRSGQAMTTVPKPSDLTATYACRYDAWNRLTFVWVDSDSDGVADEGETVIARYEYDALNRRTKEFINADTDDDFDSFRHFYYNTDWQLLETRLSTSENTEPETLQPEYQYVWSLRYIDAPVLRDKNTDSDDLCDDERLYYLNDANMNVTCLVESDGDVAERYVYDPYGKATAVYSDNWSTSVAWSASKKNPIRYGGYFFDNETGLYSVRNRMYHPHLGAWMQRDPVGYSDGMSLYQYVGSGPVVKTDAMGLGPIVDPYGTSDFSDLLSDILEWIKTTKTCPPANGGNGPDKPPKREEPPIEPVAPGPAKTVIFPPTPVPFDPPDPIRHKLGVLGEEGHSILEIIGKLALALTFGNPGCKSCEEYADIAKTAAASEPFDVKDPRYGEAMKALRSREVTATLSSLNLQNAPAEIERLIAKGTITQSKAEGEIGMTVLGKTVINVSPTKSSGDLAMQLIGEWQRLPNARGTSHHYLPYGGSSQIQKEHLVKIEAALNNFAKRAGDQYKPKHWEHPTSGLGQ